MKKILLVILIIVLMPSCINESEQRYKRASAEIDLLKNGIDYYEKADWNSWMDQYSDSAKIYQNTWYDHLSPEQAREQHELLTSKLSSYGFERKNLTMEQIIDDKGRTWVNSWGLWKGTLKSNGEVVEIPVHLTIQFVDGKVVEEWGFWDTSILNTALEESELASLEEGQ